MAAHLRINWILCFSLALVWTHAETAPEADSLYEAAVARIDAAGPEENIRALEEVLKKDYKHHAAWHELAKVYMSLHTVLGRHKAELALTHAMRLSGKNPVYEKTLARLWWEQGLYSDSARKYGQVADRDPDDAEALMMIGTKDYEEWDKYRDMYMIDLELETPAIFYWDHFAEKDRQKAMPRLERAIEKDPDVTGAYERMAVLYYERNEPTQMLALGESLAERPGRAKDGLLMSGLAHQMLGDEDEAWECYRGALDTMPDDERLILASLEAVATDGDTTLQGVEADSMDLRRFWQAEDPLFLTEYNERTMEHFGRVAYANLKFGRSDRAIPGYLTDRGQAYIRYGRYESRTASRYGGRTWHYGDMKIGFRGGPKYSDWGFNSIRRAGDTRGSRFGIKAYPPRFNDPYRMRKYPMPYQIASFKEGEAARVEVSYAIARKWIVESEPDGFVRLENGVFAFDAGWNPALREVDEEIEMPKVGGAAPHSDYLLAEHTVYLDPGTYLLAAEVRDPRTKTIGHFRDRRQLPEPASAMAMSDLLLARQITQLSPDPETRADLAIVPDPLATCQRTQPLLIYFEIYGLQKDDFGRTTYDVTYEIGWPDAGEDASVDGEEEVREPWETSVTSRYDGDRIDDLTFLAIDVRMAPSGKHLLTVRVTDRNSGENAMRGVPFTLMD